MSTPFISHALQRIFIAYVIISVGLLIMLWRKRLFSDFGYFAGLIACRAVFTALSTCMIFYRKDLHVSYALSFKIYFYAQWITFGLDIILQILTIYAIYRLAMGGLEGLQRIGQLLFRWIAGVSCGLAVFFSISPHKGTDYFLLLMEEIHQGISILALCLLLFVYLALRPLGLTTRSYIFGVNLGLGISAATTLIEAAWLPTAWGHSIFSPLALITGTTSLIAAMVWAAYFVLPEPERRMVLLPTTSPFFYWNSISEALGDAPGHVALSGFTPDMLSPAELEELSRSAHHENVSEDSDDHDDDGPGGALQRALSAPPFFPS